MLLTTMRHISELFCVNSELNQTDNIQSMTRILRISWQMNSRSPIKYVSKCSRVTERFTQRMVVPPSQKRSRTLIFETATRLRDLAT